MRVINLSSQHTKNTDLWLRQFPDGTPEWDGWRFVFNVENSEHYDYLVVFDDAHAASVPRCSDENIIHVSTEPHIYNRNFLSQFAWVITQDKTLNRAGAIPYHGGLNWHIGKGIEQWKLQGRRPVDVTASKDGAAGTLTFSQLKELFDKPKSKLLSVISSQKNVTRQHIARMNFALKLKRHYGDHLDFYGRGFADMNDKLVALRDYRFHIVIENAVHDHYFSEKIMDCMIAGAYPIYHGCPNLDQYFPENSYVAIDINDFDRSVAIIDRAIEQELDKQYRSALLEARDRVFYQHNLFPMLVGLIAGIERGDYGQPHSVKLYGQEILPLHHEQFKALFPVEVSTRIKKRIGRFFLRRVSKCVIAYDRFLAFLRVFFRKLRVKSKL